MDGEVIIKVSADTKDFDRKLIELEGRYKNKEVDIKATEYNLRQQEAELKILNDQYYRQREWQEKINQDLKKEKELLESINNTPRDYRTPEGRLQDFNLNTQATAVSGRIKNLELQQSAILTKLLEQHKLMEEQELTVNKITARYEKQKNDLEIIASKIQETKFNNDQISNANEKTSRSTGDILKKLTRWGIAIFGIRSAYAGLRQVTNNVLSQNKKLGDQMDALKKSFANAFAPIVEKIVNLVKTLMAYINYVTKTLFGKELFSTKVAKDLKSGASSAKEINKQLAGFDEANVLSSNSSGGAGAGGGTTDLGFADIKIPQWLKNITQWIKEHPDLTKILLGTAAFTILGGWIANTKLGSWVGKLIGTSGSGEALSGATGLKGLLSTCLKLAAAAVIAIEIYYLGKTALEIISELKELRKEQDLVNGSRKDAIDSTKKLGKSMRDNLQTLDKDDAARKKQIDGYGKLIDIETEAIDQMVNEMNTTRMSASQKAAQKVIIASTTEAILGEVNALGDLAKQGNLTEQEQYEYYKMLKEKMIPYMQGSSEEARIMRDRFKDLDTKFGTQYEIEVKEKGVNTVKSKFDQLAVSLSKLFGSGKGFLNIFNTLGVSDQIKKIAGNLTTIFKADGGIVNYPGRGVPLNIGGEAGREGVIPMDNQQQMALLGQEIAKYVNINNVVNNYMDGRKINTILKQSEQQERLASNG